MQRKLPCDEAQAPSKTNSKRAGVSLCTNQCPLHSTAHAGFVQLGLSAPLRTLDTTARTTYLRTWQPVMILSTIGARNERLRLIRVFSTHRNSSEPP